MKYPSSEILNLRIRLRIHIKQVLEREKSINEALKILGLSERTVYRYGFKIGRLNSYQKSKKVIYDKLRDHQNKN